MTAATPETARRPLLERYTVTRWFAIVVGGLVVVAAAGLAAGVVALDRLSDARSLLVDRVDPAVAAAARLNTAMVNEETGVRGYALSGEETFLEPFRRGRREEERAYAALAAAAGDPRLGRIQADLDAVRAATLTWRMEFARPSNRAVARGEIEPAAEQGKARFDAVRRRIGRLQGDLAAERAVALGDLDRIAGLVLGLFLAAGVLLLLSVLAAGAALRAAIIRPLATLAGDVRRVAGGDFSHHVSHGGPRDVAQLGRDVDVMRARIVAEVTALRDAEAALTSQAEELRRSNAELEQFAYVASHDLQEPLRKVASFTQMLQRRYEDQLDERAQRYIEFAVDGARRMQQLINDLLAFSRVGRGDEPYEPVDTNALVARAVENLETVIDEAGAEVAAGRLPTVHGDPGLLGGVFQNLIANAVKFRAEDRPPRVRIDARRTNGEWRFTCADNGIGVEPEYAERIFVIFQRLHTRTEYEGTGIGLAMCRKIIEYHGGRIWLGPPPPDGGSTFCFTLPADGGEPPPG
jgi:signal transduction histidine kinase